MPYIITIIAAMAATVALNLVFPGGHELTLLNASFMVAVSTVAVIAIDGFFAFVIRRLPERFFDYRQKFYTVGKKERKLYKHLGVKRWRGLVMELGMFTSFSKSEFKDPSNPKYTARFLLESCYGVTIHLACIAVGFFVLLIFPEYALRIGLPVALVNAFLNLLPIFVLRYNTPKIKSVHERNLRLQERHKILEST